MITHLRGFTLLISLILTSVILAVGVALIDIAVKQLTLSSSARNSQAAFYNADSALECALYYDQKVNAFYYNEAQNIALECNGVDLASYPSLTNYSESQTASIRTTTFSLPCSGGTGISGTVNIYKQPSGITDIYATGYNSCSASDPNRIERGVKIHY